MTPTELLMIAGMALVTFAVRYPVLGLSSRFTLPPSVRHALQFIPPAVLAAIIAPAVLLRNGETLHIHYSNPFLVAGGVAALVAWRSRNLLLTISIGMATLWSWMVWFPG